MPALLIGATAGLIAGLAMWRWLRTGNYRRPIDDHRVDLRRSWLVVPAAGAAGSLGGWFPGWLATAVWIYVVGGVLISWIDLDVQRIPDRILATWAPLVGVTVTAAAVNGPDWGLLARAAAGAAGLGAWFIALALAGSMGFGDVKLAAVTGVLTGALGWVALALSVLVGFTAGAIAGVGLLARGRDPSSHLAFGPAIVLGAAVAALQAGCFRV